MHGIQLPQMARALQAPALLLLAVAVTYGQEAASSSKLRVTIASAASVTISTVNPAGKKPEAQDIAGTTSFSYNIRSETDAATGLLQFALARETDGTSANAAAARPDTLSWGCFEDSGARSCLNEHAKVGPVQTAFFSVEHNRKSNTSAGTLSWKLSDDRYENPDAHTTVTLTVSGI